MIIFNREALIHLVNIRDILQGRTYEVSGVDILVVVSQAFKDMRGISQSKAYARPTGTGAFSSRNPLASTGEVGFQVGLGTLETCFYGIFVDLENGADIIEGKSQHHPKNIHYTLFIGQTKGHEVVAFPPDLNEEFVVEAPFFWIALTTHHLIGNILLKLLNDLVKRINVRPVHLSFNPEAVVDRGPVDPGVNCALSSEFIQTLIHLQKSLLGYVFRILPVADQSISQVIHFFAVGLNHIFDVDLFHITPSTVF